MEKKQNVKDIKTKLTEKFNNLSPENKRKVIMILVIIAIIFVGTIGYIWSRGGNVQQRVVENRETTKEIKLDSGMLEKTQLAESQRKISELQEKVNMILEDKKKMEEELKKKEEQEKLEKEKEKQAKMTPPAFNPPPPHTPIANMPPIPSGEPGVIKTPEPPKVETIGGIGMVSQQIQEKKEPEKKQDTKKKYYLPTSFMEATLLSGLDAPAISKAEGNPMPALFRIKAPAVLPNKVKANLKGCFVIAEGLGSLADERAHLRLVSLSCIDRKGNAVIDQKVKGFVVDNDGKIGLRGRVVSKMGAHIVRSLIAGLFGGIGQVAGTQAYTYNVTGSGTITTLDTGKAAQAAIGAGVQQAAQSIQKFYLELAQQTIPVIEIQATRNVTLVISEGVELEIKEYNLKD
ncbi:TraB/VirB10 family protein [Thermodesulfovibrio sp. 3907-1M]|uniref:TraB/VirB10 family protein n=1 Tax=Thermodesulfovibrio autotrophicus TaxID=3118333 RepID=A0AAU8GZ75_9BACT